MRITCKAKGVAEIITAFKQYDADTQVKLKKVVRRSLLNIKKGAKSRIHDVTGTLSRRIVNSYNRDDLGGAVRSKAPHSHLVEFGTKPHGQEPRPRSKALRFAGRFFEKITHPGSKPKPFLQPAYYAEIGSYTQNIKKAVQYKA